MGQFLQEGKLTGRTRGSKLGKKSSSPARDKAGAQGKAVAPLPLEKREAADYLAGMLKGLHEVASRADLRFLSYLIEVAMHEAQAEKARTDSR